MKIVERGPNYIVIDVSAEVRVLFSYSTPVAAFVSGRGYVKTERFYSRTTSKHVSKFLDGRTAEVIPQAEFEKLAGEGAY